MELTKEDLEVSIRKLERWVEDHNYKAYEPFDGLSSPLRRLTFGNLLLERILQQIIRQSPINLRPLLGVKPLESTKGRGYMAAGYLAMFKVTSDPVYAENAVNCLEWLDQNKSPKFHHHSWANHFPFAGRGGMYEKHESIVVWTSLIGHAFLDGYEILKIDKYLNVARSACSWILDLPREKTSTGTCLSYLAPEQSSIHNANMLGAAFLVRTGKISGENKLLEVAREAMEYSCTRQLSDGSWWYAEDPKYHWIDNFHTGYNLDSLKCYIDCSGDQEYMPQLKNGFSFYKEHFFEESGRPRYYHNRTFPVDSQCISQSIETLSNFAEDDPEALPLAKKVALWTIENMQDKDGYLYYRQYPGGIKAKTPMLHWAQATSYKALARLLKQMSAK